MHGAFEMKVDEANELFAILNKNELEAQDLVTLKRILTNNAALLDEQDSDGNYPVILSAKNGRTKALKLMIDTNRSVLEQYDKEWCTAAIWAAKNGHTKALKLMIEAQLSVLEQADMQGGTAALWAAANGHRDALKLMMEADLSVLQQQDRLLQGTPALWASMNGHGEMLTMIIKKDHSLSLQCATNGNTTAIWAAVHGLCEPLKLMIEYNLMVLQHQDNDGNTMAIWATRHGHSQALKLMIDANIAVLLQQDNDGLTPALWAAQEGHSKVQKLIYIYTATKDTAHRVAQESAGNFPVEDLQKLPLMADIKSLVVQLRQALIDLTASVPALAPHQDQEKVDLMLQLRDMLHQNLETLCNEIGPIFPEFDQIKAILFCRCAFVNKDIDSVCRWAETITSPSSNDDSNDILLTASNLILNNSEATSATDQKRVNPVALRLFRLCQAEDQYFLIRYSWKTLAGIDLELLRLQMAKIKKTITLTTLPFPAFFKEPTAMQPQLGILSRSVQRILDLMSADQGLSTLPLAIVAKVLQALSECQSALQALEDAVKYVELNVALAESILLLEELIAKCPLESQTKKL